MPQKSKKSAHPQWILEQKRFLQIGELKRLVEVSRKCKNKALLHNKITPVKDWFLICVATETGMRVQEIADLSCGDIQGNGSFRLVIVRNGKGGKPRPVIVRKEFLRQASEFLAWKKEQGDSVDNDAPFFASGGQRMGKRALQKSYGRSMRRAGIVQARGVGIHSLRHTYASFLLKASKFNLSLVQKQLGHASVKTTEVYAHVLDADMRRAVERLYD